MITIPRYCPGPWTNDANHAVLDKWGNQIVTIVPIPHFDNAELIAQAPELLETLDRLLNCAELKQDELADDTRALLAYAWKLHDELTPTPCAHLPERQYAWTVGNGDSYVACCECGEVLVGANIRDVS